MAKRAAPKCSQCGGSGHNKKTCPNPSFTTAGGVRVRRLAPGVSGGDLGTLDPVPPAPAVDLAVRVRVEIQVVQLNPDGSVIGAAAAVQA